jgi:hypothetical protein
MPAALPGVDLTTNQANPSAGAAVLLDPLSGPKASPFDARKITGWTAQGMPTYANDPLNCSTGGLATGIGFGLQPIINGLPSPNAAGGVFAPGSFCDDYVPGQDLPSGAAAANSSIMYIGGGRSDAAGVTNPYAVGMVGLCGAGAGSSRDGGTTPFTGFPMKTVTATGTVADAAAIETGFTNRTGKTLATGQSAFGSATAALTDVT